MNRLLVSLKCTSLIIGLIGMASAAVSAAEEPPLLRLTEGSWRESYDEARPVSGGLYVGTIFGDASNTIDTDRLFVHLPRTSAPILCVEVVTRDARYQAKAFYSVAGRAAGAYQLELRSDYTDKLESYRADEVGVTARLMNDCDQGQPIALVPVSWGVVGDARQVTVQLNASGLQSRLLIQEDTDSKGKQIVDCELIEQDATKTSFDTLCQFSATVFTKLCDLRLRQRRHGRWLRDKKLKLMCAQ